MPIQFQSVCCIIIIMSSIPSLSLVENVGICPECYTPHIHLIIVIIDCYISVSLIHRNVDNTDV